MLNSTTDSGKPNIRLGINIDHVATLRQARGVSYPDPIHAAMLAAEAGADGITLHLREDRRHIQDRDVSLLQERCPISVNLEMAATEEMVAIAEKIRPQHCCLVPEKREELTTEGGLDVVSQQQSIKTVCDRLAAAGIQVSLFIDPEPAQIEAAIECGAPAIELHTGQYADANNDITRAQQLLRIVYAAQLAHQSDLIVNAGHGLHYHNVQPIAAISVINELNIGHSIIAHAVFVGIKSAVKEMKALMVEARLLQSRVAVTSQEAYA